MKKTILFLATAALMLTSCGSKKPVVKTSAFQSYETECLGKDMDGQQRLKVWADGTDRNDAIRQAKKKAVYEVVFTGITAGGGECNAYPVVDAPNARQKYAQYFDKFFADNGGYKKYVEAMESKSDADKLQGDKQVKYGIIVKVDRPGLRKRFEKDKIIEKLNQ